jgi:integral membrane sensor domain MASE1
VRLRHRVRLVVNLLNGSTLAGLATAKVGGASLARLPDGLAAGTGYRLPVPSAPAFTLGYAWCGGLLMLPLYFAAAGASWLVSGDVGAWNVFERTAGLADGDYADRPLRPWMRWDALSR